VLIVWLGRWLFAALVLDSGVGFGLGSSQLDQRLADLLQVGLTPMYSSDSDSSLSSHTNYPLSDRYCADRHYNIIVNCWPSI